MLDEHPAPIKRYAPPNQRNRGLNRRKSGDRSERASIMQPNDGDKNLRSMDHPDAGSLKFINEGFCPQLITLNGCSNSPASQILQERWKTAVDCYNDPKVDLSERPVMYSGSGASAWGNLRLPHQLMSSPQMDFLGELRHAIHKCNANLKS